MANNILSEMKNAGISIDVAPNKLRTVIYFNIGLYIIFKSALIIFELLNNKKMIFNKN